MTNHYNKLYEWLHQHNQYDWSKMLQDVLPLRFSAAHHGDFRRWQTALAALPPIDQTTLGFSQGAVKISSDTAITPDVLSALKSALLEFHPWRKGPFDLFGLHIDTEWRSDIKWSRLADAVGSLQNKAVLDIGCGNGYYMMRMLEHTPEMLIGIDTTLLFIMQFQAIQTYLQAENIYALPISMDELPDELDLFDTVFMMGVLYHRREPLTDLAKIRHWLKADGQLVLETLITTDDETLIPKDRYAQMRNVWMVPSINTLERWLYETGYSDIQIIDITKTTTDEQRQTEWMRFQSLQDFLDPEDRSKTIEGYPAPVRAIISARSPGLSD